METTGRDTFIRTKRQKEKRARRMRRMRRMLYVVFFIWGVLGLIGLFAVAQYVLSAATGKQESVYGCGADETSAFTPQPVRAGVDEDGDKERKAPELSAEERAECARLYQENPELLVIANKQRELPQDYSPKLRFICNGRLQAASVIYDDLTAMLEAAGDAGFDYWIASGYRSRQRQQELIDEDVQACMEDGISYEAALEKTLEETMPAGHSEHETGLSLDILCAGNTNMDASQASEPGNRWLVEHCSEFGFILRYPEDQETITGIAYEPWHFRYVGRDAAQFMTEKGLTLEAFWENLAFG